MKIVNLVSIIFLFIFFSCTTQVKTDAQKVNFGIYEMVKIDELPEHILDSVKAKNVQIENNTQSSIIGHILKSDSPVLQLDFTSENIKLIKTYHTLTPDNECIAIAAVKLNPVMTNFDIKNTKVNGRNVNIEFNLEGAKKWADMTKNNVGNTIAFVIDNQIYSMPKVGAEIKGGVAMIYGLENESIAKGISESLNAGRE